MTPLQVTIGGIETDWASLGLQALATLVGAAIGALAAFQVQAKQQRSSQAESESALWMARAVAVRKAQLHLMAQRTALRTMAGSHIGDVRDDPDRWWKLRPFSMRVPVPEIDLNALGEYLFIEEPSTMLILFRAQSYYDALWDAIRDRNNRVVEYSGAMVARLQGDMDHEAARAELAMPLGMNLREVTDTLYSMLYFAANANQQACDALEEQARKDIDPRVGGLVMDLGKLPDWLLSKDLVAGLGKPPESGGAA